MHFLKTLAISFFTLSGYAYGELNVDLEVRGGSKANVRVGDRVAVYFQADDADKVKTYLRVSSDDQCGNLAGQRNSWTPRRTGNKYTFVVPTCFEGRRYKIILIGSNGRERDKDAVVLDVANLTRPKLNNKQDLVGVNIDHPNHSRIKIEKSSETGFGWIRLTIYWPDVETRQGEFNWTATDKAIAFAKKRGFKVLAKALNVPAWANGWTHPKDKYCEVWRHGNCNSVPYSADYYKNFMKVLGKRYKGYIDAYEIWNEPNSFRFWNSKPEEFESHILRPGIEGLRESVPNAFVVAPALILNRVVYGEEIAEILYRRNKTLFDAFGIHSYSPQSNSVQAFVNEIRAIGAFLERYNIGRHDKIWVTELGMTANNRSTLPEVKLQGQINQAQVITKFLRGVDQTEYFRDAEYLEIVDKTFIYRFEDHGFGPNDWMWGIYTASPEYAPKPIHFELLKYFGLSP